MSTTTATAATTRILVRKTTTCYNKNNNKNIIKNNNNIKLTVTTEAEKAIAAKIDSKALNKNISINNYHVVIFHFNIRIKQSG